MEQEQPRATSAATAMSIVHSVAQTLSECSAAPRLTTICLAAEPAKDLSGYCCLRQDNCVTNEGLDDFDGGRALTLFCD